MRKNVLLIIIFFMIVTLFSGCNSGKVDIADLAMVMAVGIDKGEKEGAVLVTVQVALPSNARGQTGTPAGGGQGEPIWTATGEGKTIFEAIRNIGRYSSRRLFWAHNHVIIIGGEYARDVGLTDVIDFFTRNNQLRLNTWMVVTPKKAKDLVATKTGLEVISGESIEKLFRYSAIIAEAPKTNMRILAASYMSVSSHPILAMVDLKTRGVSTEKPGEFGSTPQVELSGTGVFKRDKLVGWLTPSESRGLLWFIQKVDSVIYGLRCPDDPKKPASVEVKSYKFKVTPNYKDGKATFKVKLTVYGELVELGCPTKLENPTILADLEIELTRAIKKEIKTTLDKAQKEFNVDFLKLGETFENRYPKEWEQLRDRWSEVFPTVDVSVMVESNIKSPALLENPTRPLKD